MALMPSTIGPSTTGVATYIERLNPLEIAHFGLDTLVLHYRAKFLDATLLALRSAKEQAGEADHPVPFIFPGSNVSVLLHAYGVTGGFEFKLTDTYGIVWICMASSRNRRPNVRATVGSDVFLTHSLRDICDHLLRFLPSTETEVQGHSVSRLDYAVDVRDDTFVLDLERFVAPSGMRKVPYWESSGLAEKASAVITGDTLRTVTIGRSGNRQVSVYDKTWEARVRHHGHWFRVWGIDPADAAARVWRTEFRLSRKALRSAGVNSLADLKLKLRPALEKLASNVRYVAPSGDTNKARRPPDRHWKTVLDHLDAADLPKGVPELDPADLAEMTVTDKEKLLWAQMEGCARSLMVLTRINEDALTGELRRRLHNQRSEKKQRRTAARYAEVTRNLPRNLPRTEPIEILSL